MVMKKEGDGKGDWRGVTSEVLNWKLLGGGIKMMVERKKHGDRERE